jgi:hypothetical protein
VNQVGIPCLFKYFTEVPEWREGFAFIAPATSGGMQSAYIALNNYPHHIRWYCLDIKSEALHVWIPSSPVLKELYEIEGLP